ncbi:hypothetical protein TNCV_3061381 [Trichonephila clavipes]|nr:hypothetical protein TNCV_3061381 [Trichonephila clavipes]
MFDSSSYVNPTHLAHADTSRDVLPRGGTSQEGEKDFNDGHREANTGFVQSTPRFQDCDEDVEAWMACDAEDCLFQMLNDDEIVTSVQEEFNPVVDETDEDEDNNNSNETRKGSLNSDVFSAL